MSVLMLFSFATFHNDHISKVISDARAFSRCQFLKILLMGRPHRRRFGRDLVRFQGRAAAACAPAVSCWVCCCFAQGLWEVLALWGQLRTPPSSCSDRHQALTQTFSLFHFISGLSNGPQMGPENVGASRRAKYPSHIWLSSLFSLILIDVHVDSHQYIFWLLTNLRLCLTASFERFFLLFSADTLIFVLSFIIIWHRTNELNVILMFKHNSLNDIQSEYMLSSETVRMRV